MIFTRFGTTLLRVIEQAWGLIRDLRLLADMGHGEPLQQHRDRLADGGLA